LVGNTASDVVKRLSVEAWTSGVLTARGTAASADS